MGTFTLGEDTGGSFPKREPIPAGEILVTEILTVMVRDSFFDLDETDPSKGKKQEVSFKFKVCDERYPEYDDRFLWGNTPTTFTSNENCKLRQWVEEIYSFDELPVGFHLDTDQLEGQYVKVIVGNRNGRDKEGNAVVREFVDSVMRVQSFEDAADAF